MQTGFSMAEILRKYIRYALNEKPFNPKMVAALIQLRKTTMLEDSQVAEILNEISRRIVKDKGTKTAYALCKHKSNLLVRFPCGEVLVWISCALAIL